MELCRDVGFSHFECIITGNKGILQAKAFPMKKLPLVCCGGVAVSSTVTKPGMLSLQPHNLSAHEVCTVRFTSLSPLCWAALPMDAQLSKYSVALLAV